MMAGQALSYLVFHLTRSALLRSAHNVKAQGMDALADIPCRYLLSLSTFLIAQSVRDSRILRNRPSSSPIMLMMIKGSIVDKGNPLAADLACRVSLK